MHRGLSPEKHSFRGFELDVSAFELRRDGRPVRLERQPMELLILLVERRGELVSRRDIVARLWTRDVFVDVDTGINTAIRKIRLALGDSSEAPAFVETVPGKGYRFTASVETTPFPPEGSSPARSPSRPRMGSVLAVIAGGAVLIGVLTGWLRSPASPPRVTGTTQITSDLVAKSGSLNDGSRIYFNELPSAGVSVLAQVAAAGGEVMPIGVRLPAPLVVDLSPDGSELLVTSHPEPPTGPQSTPELWIVPVVGGAPRRVGALLALDATWSSDGRSIVYTTDTESVYLANSDGSGSRKVWTAPGHARWPALSRDGQRVRLTVFPRNTPPSLWEVGADGGAPHLLRPEFESPACCGRWTSDGRYFLFDAYDKKHGTPDIWALRERASWSFRSAGEPVRLTQGPIKFFNPVASRDGRRIFAVGEMERGELVRLDPRSGRFVPYLGGVSAFDVGFSSDRQWVAYVSYPDGMLWRSRVDGSDRVQLTRPPLSAGGPPEYLVGTRWSPDGKRLVFQGTIGIRTATYLISADGGVPEPVPMPDDRGWAPESWSPDGQSLALGSGGDPASPIQLLDLRTGRFSRVPGSEGLRKPLWSPDGRHLVALSADGLRLVLYDASSSRWRELLSGKERLDFPSWSRNGRSLFVSEGTSRVRLEVADGRREVVARFDGLRRPWNTRDWVGQAPDDSVITLRDLSVQEIFALDWDAP